MGFFTVSRIIGLVAVIIALLALVFGASGLPVWLFLLLSGIIVFFSSENEFKQFFRYKKVCWHVFLVELVSSLVIVCVLLVSYMIIANITAPLNAMNLPKDVTALSQVADSTLQIVTSSLAKLIVALFVVGIILLAIYSIARSIQWSLLNNRSFDIWYFSWRSSVLSVCIIIGGVIMAVGLSIFVKPFISGEAVPLSMKILLFLLAIAVTFFVYLVSAAYHYFSIRKRFGSIFLLSPKKFIIPYGFKMLLLVITLLIMAILSIIGKLAGISENFTL